MKSLSHKNEITRERIAAFLLHDRGLSIVEYAIAAGLVAAAIAASFGAMGATIDAVIVTIMGFL